MLSVFLVIYIFLICIVLLLDGRHILGSKPISYEVAFKTPITVEQLKALLQQVIDEFTASGYDFYLYDESDNLSINTGDKNSNIVFGFDAWCYILNKNGNIHFEDGKLYDSVILEGNYFISSKKVKQNMQFVHDFYNVLIRSMGLCHVLFFIKKAIGMPIALCGSKSSGLVSYNQLKQSGFQTSYVDYINNPKLLVKFYPTLLGNRSR